MPSNNKMDETKEGKRSHSDVLSSSSATENPPPPKRRAIERDSRDDLESILKRLDELERSNSHLKDQINSLSEENVDLKKQVQELNDKVENLEQYGRRMNVRLFGVREFNAENTERLVCNLARDLLGIVIGPAEISACHRIGRKINMKCRPIICQFTSKKIATLMIDAAKKHRRQLQAERILIVEDLTKHRFQLIQDGRQMIKKHELV
jgi:predicted RNase H-like nuclease (RuvC/YqgF family)